MSRPYEVAEHEAAHVVVGAALGLRLRHATAQRTPGEHGFAWYKGYTWFADRGTATSHAIMYAAGCAYERSVGGIWRAGPDEILLRQMLPGRGNFQTCVRAADAMLRGLARVHGQVTRALCTRDLGNAEIEAIARGERL